MTYRIDLETREQDVTVLFQGRLDEAALDDLATRCRDRLRRGSSVRVRLGVGTVVEGDVLERLAGLGGVSIEAESPFLSRWIQSCLVRKNS